MLQSLQLRGSPYKAAQSLGYGALEPSAARVSTRYTPEFDRFGEAFEYLFSEGFETDRTSD
jgi:hypothetical protein